MARTANLAPVGLLLLAGSLVMLWFVILSGVTRTSPLRQTYFLRADTSGIEGARDVSQWTYFHVCGDGNADCGPARPALPLGDAWAGGADNGAPEELVGGYGGDTTSFHYWYMWRFGWVFYLLALFFEVLAFFAGFLALCSRLGSAFTGVLSLVTLVFLTVAVSLMTATFVQMRNAFTSDGRAASLGRYAFGFSWGSWAALLLATILFFLSKRKRKDPGLAGAPAGTSSVGRSRRSWLPWRRRRAAYDGRRVKEDYA